MRYKQSSDIDLISYRIASNDVFEAIFVANEFRSSAVKVISHEKNNTVVKVTPPSKNIVLLFGQPEKVVISISLPN